MRKTLTEVQALRAIAVIAVVVYHIQPRSLPGGFVGVDVFFVISGFLITRHMLKEVAERGSLSLVGFWANRARRILPASLLVIVATVAAGWFLFPIEEVRRNSSQALASTLYMQNWSLAAESVDYLAADNLPTPFQHFWSLSVEEQFYLAWPILLIAIVWLTMRSRRTDSTGAATRRQQIRIGAAFSVVVLVSFGYSVMQVSSGDAAAYFSTFSRLWELGVGGVLACFYREPVAKPGLRSLTAIAGFVMIALACWRLNANTPFPGIAALLPVTGAVLVILAGRTVGPLSLTRLVELRPVQVVGDWSYSIYLWHFGFVVAATTMLGTVKLPWWAKAGIVVATLAASYLSYRFVEQPFRTRKWATAPPRRVLSLAAVGLVLTSIIALALPLRLTATEQDWARRSAGLTAIANFQADPNAPGPLEPFPDGNIAMTPDPLQAPADRPSEATRVNPVPGEDPHQCQGLPSQPSTPECVAGVPSSPTRVVLVGDSHANVMITPLAAIATQRNWRLETYSHASCPFSLATRTKELHHKIQCRQPNAELLQKLLSDPPALVISVSWAEIDWADFPADPAAGAKGYADMWSKLRSAGIPVVVFRDTPRPKPTVMRCMTANYGHPQICAAAASTAFFRRDEVTAAAAAVPGTRVVSLDKLMCDQRQCPTVINHILIYRDANHITNTWAKALTSAIASQLPTDLHR